MQFPRSLAVIAPLLAMACAPTKTGLRHGPYAGYDIERQSTETDTINEAGVVKITRKYQISPPGRSTQYLTSVIDVENKSDFAFCVRLGAETKYSNVTVVDKGVVVVGPHSVQEAVVVVSSDEANLVAIHWSTKKKAWPADREGRCEQ
jgi:hypothetical protein